MRNLNVYVVLTFLLIFGFSCLSSVSATDYVRVLSVNMAGDSTPAPYSANILVNMESTYRAWKCFDDATYGRTVYLGANVCQSNQQNMQLWLDLGSGNATVVTAYNVTNENYTSYTYDPFTWKVYGSNDNSVWTLLDTQTSVNWTSHVQTKQFAFSNSVAYRYLLFNVTNNVGNSGAATVLAQLRYLKDAPSGYSIRGNISLNGVAFANATVILMTNSSCFGYTTTNSTGGYNFSGVVNGTQYSVFAQFINSTVKYQASAFVNTTMIAD